MPTATTTRSALTIDQLMALARVGSNNCWLRWWAHYNFPANPVQMAISVMDEAGKTVLCPDLERKGFERVINTRGFIIYVCDRVDEHGAPYHSRL